MTVESLANALAARHGFSKAFARRVLATFLDTVRVELKAGRPVKIRNFGAFSARTSRGKRRAAFSASPNFFR